MITKLKAEKLAQTEATRLAEMPDRKNREYNQVEFLRDNNEAFVFFAACPELLKQDFAPGGIMVFVDKQTGRIKNRLETRKQSLQLQTA